MATPAEIKKALQVAGFEIYRTRGDVVHLADRVRENLLMDANVYLRAPSLAVGLVVRAQKSDFPNDGDVELFDRARRLAAAAVERGYVEVRAEIHEVSDPGDEARTIDRWCEIGFERELASVDLAIADVGFALGVEKAAAR